jgi:hypothetical protein
MEFVCLFVATNFLVLEVWHWTPPIAGPQISILHLCRYKRAYKETCIALGLSHIQGLLIREK